MALPCPNCKTPIGLTLDFIVKNPVSVCPSCKTVFNFAVSEEIEDIKKQYSGSVKFG
jgi:uncharacterized protein YbaR (Trm112 family)